MEVFIRHIRFVHVGDGCLNASAVDIIRHVHHSADPFQIGQEHFRVSGHAQQRGAASARAAAHGDDLLRVAGKNGVIGFQITHARFQIHDLIGSHSPALQPFAVHAAAAHAHVDVTGPNIIAVNAFSALICVQMDALGFGTQGDGIAFLITVDGVLIDDRRGVHGIGRAVQVGEHSFLVKGQGEGAVAVVPGFLHIFGGHVDIQVLNTGAFGVRAVDHVQQAVAGIHVGGFAFLDLAHGGHDGGAVDIHPLVHQLGRVQVIGFRLRQSGEQQGKKRYCRQDQGDHFLHGNPPSLISFRTARQRRF